MIVQVYKCTRLTGEICFTQFCCKKRGQIWCYIMNSQYSPTTGCWDLVSFSYVFCVQPEPLYTCPFGDNWENSTGNILCRCSVHHLPILYFPFQYAVTQSFAIPCVPPALTTRRKKSQSIFAREYKDLASVDRWILQWANLFMSWFSTEKETIYIYIILVSYFFN